MTDPLANELCALARSLFERGFSSGSSGNISARHPEGGYICTPTNTSLGRLRADRLSRLDDDFRHIGGDPPTKEVPLHRAFYQTRGDRAGAVLHLHSPYAVALSILTPDDPADVLPHMTPYPLMRLGRVPRLPFHLPGDGSVEVAIAALDGRSKAVLLANHGPVVSDHSLEAAVNAAEELEDAARLVFLIGDRAAERLSQEQVQLLLHLFC